MYKLSTVLALPLCCGLALAQDSRTTPQSTGSGAMGNNGRTWVGILVDANCSSGSGMSGAGSMAKSGSTNRTTSAQSGRDWNSTDRNTSGTADRTGSTSTPNATSTGNASDMARRTTGSDNIARTTGSSDRARGRTNGADTTRGSDIAPTTGSADLARTTGAMGAARGTDTQNGNNLNTARNSTGNMTGSDVSGNWDRSCFISPASSSFMLQLQDGRRMKIDDAGNARISSQMKSTGRVSGKNKVFRVNVTGSADGDTLHITDIQM